MWTTFSILSQCPYGRLLSTRGGRAPEKYGSIFAHDKTIKTVTCPKMSAEYSTYIKFKSNCHCRFSYVPHVSRVERNFIRAIDNGGRISYYLARRMFCRLYLFILFIFFSFSNRRFYCAMRQRKSSLVVFVRFEETMRDVVKRKTLVITIRFRKTNFTALSHFLAFGKYIYKKKKKRSVRIEG